MQLFKIICTVVLALYGTQIISAGPSDPPKKTICLNMIVKDEKEVICRCLESVKPIIDYWVIVDTGSTDGTQQMINEYMKDVPGELIERPWINFGHNRSEAVALAKGKADYLLIIDADDELTFSKDFSLPILDKDAYDVAFDDCNTTYYRTQLVNNHIPWKWVGVLHEYIDSPQRRSSGTLHGITYIRNYDGARSKDPKKYEKDAQVLEEGLKKEPNNHRYVFYLAQSYGDANLDEKALENYKRRAKMGGWDEEVYYSLLKIGLLQEKLNMPSNVIVEGYNKAFEFRPRRAESLYQLARYYREKGDYLAGLTTAKKGMAIPIPNDTLFVQVWAYKYGLPFEYSLCSYWTGNYEEARRVSVELLSLPDLPDYWRDYVINNLVWIYAKLGEAQKAEAKGL